MPLVRITLKEGHSSEQCRAIADGVYDSLREAIKIPENDRFQVILEQAGDKLIADKNYMDIPRTGDSVFVEITLRRGRTKEMKKALYREIPERLFASAGIAKEDILIVLTENDDADWSFGLGEAQYVK